MILTKNEQAKVLYAACREVRDCFESHEDHPASYDVVINAIEAVDESVVAEKIERQEARTVDIKSAGYTWLCPHCFKSNDECKVAEVVGCGYCGRSFDANPPKQEG